MRTVLHMLSQHAVTLVWLMLIAATGLSWSLGSDHGASGASAVNATLSLILIAMLKVRLVILYFMEVRTAPLPLRLVCEAWIVVVGVTLVGLYLLR